jgi:hypothetical protein
MMKRCRIVAREIGGLLHFIGALAAFYGGALLLAWAGDQLLLPIWADHQLAHYTCPF